MHDYYFEDLKSGDKFTSPNFTLSAQELIEFARKYDPQPFHLDREAAEESHFGAAVAGGFQTAALGWTLAIKTGVFRKCALVGLGVEELKWLKLVRAGDTLSCTFEVLEARVSSSRPGTRITVSRFDLANQSGDLVFTMRMAQPLKFREALATSSTPHDSR